MLRKLFLATLVCLCMALSVSAQRRERDFETNDNNVIDADKYMERVQRQREAANRLADAQRNYERAKAKEEAADAALDKADPNHPQADRLARDAAKASRERATSEATRDIRVREAESVGAVREARVRGGKWDN